MSDIESIRSSIASSRALCAAATKGPWAITPTRDLKRIIIGEGANSYGTDVGEINSDDADYDEAKATAVFIAHARQALPAHVDALEIAVAALEEAVLVLRGEVPPQYAGVDREGLPIELEHSSAETTCGMMAMGLTATIVKIVERLKENNDGKT